MSFAFFFNSIVLGIIEGVTEFLPISSTGHLIVAGSILGYDADAHSTFFISIQLGAILAVCWEYRRRLTHVALTLHKDPLSRKLVANLIIAMIPAAVVGLIAKKAIETRLFAPVPVSIALIVGALVIFIAERYYRRHPASVRIHSVDEMSWKDALKVGFAQMFSLIPGTSRSGATIIGGMLFGISRVAATDFSVFLASPVMFCATFYSLLTDPNTLASRNDWIFLAIAFVFSFISAFLCVRWLLRYVSSNTFIPFAWYRIAFGIFILAMFFGGVIQW
jgi:undecaprenyl-diphosphatase